MKMFENNKQYIMGELVGEVENLDDHDWRNEGEQHDLDGKIGDIHVCHRCGVGVLYYRGDWNGRKGPFYMRKHHSQEGSWTRMNTLKKPCTINAQITRPYLCKGTIEYVVGADDEAQAEEVVNTVNPKSMGIRWLIEEISNENIPEGYDGVKIPTSSGDKFSIQEILNPTIQLYFKKNEAKRILDETVRYMYSQLRGEPTEEKLRTIILNDFCELLLSGNREKNVGTFFKKELKDALVEIDKLGLNEKVLTTIMYEVLFK